MYNVYMYMYVYKCILVHRVKVHVYTCPTLHESAAQACEYIHVYV